MPINKAVCIVTAFYEPHIGGVELYSKNMAIYLSREGYRVFILTTNAGGAIPGIDVNAHYTIYRLPVMHLFADRFPIPSFFSLKFGQMIKELKKNQIQTFFINTRFYLTTWIGLYLSAKQNSKRIIIEHGSGHVQTGHFLKDKFVIVIEHLATALQLLCFKPKYFGVSNACNQWLTHFGIKAEGILYNSIAANTELSPISNYRARYNLSNDAVIFSYAGRLIEEKGVIFLLDIFVEFAEKHEHAFLFVAGSGPLLKEVETHRNKNVIILGELNHSEILELLSSTDVVLIPSNYPEGLPTLILEAGMHKCAVIATDKGGTREVIENENIGLVVPANNRILFLNAMSKLIIDPDYRKSLQENLYQKVLSGFSWKSNISKVCKIIEGGK